MPKQYEQIILTSSGGLARTAVYLWRPVGEVLGCVQIIHGMREHMGRYSDFAAFLTSQGYAVCGHDHMGHGRSGSTDSAFGYFGETDGPKNLIRDCRRVTRLIQREFPGTPLFVLGHSMGSFLGRLYILHAPKEIAGFICMGTGGRELLAPVARVLSELAVRIGGAKTEGRLLDKLTFRSYKKRCADDPYKMAWLSRDGQVVEQYEFDALIRPYFTNSGYRDLYEIQMAASGKRWARLVDQTLPILLLSGSEDPVGGYGKGVAAVYEDLKLAGVLDVTCKLYDGARHEVLNELNREEVYYDLLTWMEAATQPIL